MEYYFPGGRVESGEQPFTLAENLPENSFSFGGTWQIGDEYSTTGKNAALEYRFYANKVYLVLSPPKGKEAVVNVFSTGKAG